MSTLASTIVKVKSLGPGNPIHVYEGDCDVVSVGVSTTQMAEQDIAVEGLGANDIPLSFTIIEASFFLTVSNFRVKAAGVLAVTFSNPDDAAVDPASTVTYRLVAAAA
jgi:hypothetical protein